jgi:hypothetical protein
MMVPFPFPMTIIVVGTGDRYAHQGGRHSSGGETRAPIDRASLPV